MQQPIKKQVSTILLMYEKEMVKYPYFKMIFSIEEATFISELNRDDKSLIDLWGMVNMYMTNGISKQDAMYKAREVICDFYTVCDMLTKRTNTIRCYYQRIRSSKSFNSNWHKHDREEDLSED